MPDGIMLILGLKLAAMRLRQLGTSQSITFFIPPEVHQVIADLQTKSKRKSHTIDSHDV
jgi:hypothetical protein